MFYCLPPLNWKHKLSLQGSSAHTISAGRGRDHDNADGDIFCGGYMKDAEKVKGRYIGL